MSKGASGFVWKHKEHALKPAAHFLHSIQEQEAIQEPSQPRSTQTGTNQQLRNQSSPSSSAAHEVNYSLNLPRYQLHSAFNFPTRRHNWTYLTSDLWIFQTVMGYSLELLATPSQLRPPHHLGTPNRIRCLRTPPPPKLYTKRVVMEVQPETGQFLSRLFLTPKQGWLPT